MDTCTETRGCHFCGERLLDWQHKHCSAKCITAAKAAARDEPKRRYRPREDRYTDTDDMTAGWNRFGPVAGSSDIAVFDEAVRLHEAYTRTRHSLTAS